MPIFRSTDPIRQFSLFPSLAGRGGEVAGDLAKTGSLTLTLSVRDKDRLDRLAADKGETPARLIQSALTLANDDILAGVTPLPAGHAKLRVRLPADVSEETARAALAFVLALADGSFGRPATAGADRLDEARDAVERLAFEPLPSGVRSPRQAAHVMGFPGELGLTEAQISARFRKLAPVYHPDTGFITGGQHMSQLLEARRILLDYMRGD